MAATLLQTIERDEARTAVLRVLAEINPAHAVIDLRAGAGQRVTDALQELADALLLDFTVAEIRDAGSAVNLGITARAAIAQVRAYAESLLSAADEAERVVLPALQTLDLLPAPEGQF